MDATAAKMMIDGLDIPEFKKGMKKFKKEIQARIDADSCYQGQADDVIEFIDRLQAAFAKVNKGSNMPLKEVKKILPDFIGYLQACLIVLKAKAQENDNHDNEDDDVIEDEVGRQLEGIDVEDFFDEDDELEMVDEASQKENKLIELNKRMKSRLNL